MSVSNVYGLAGDNYRTAWSLLVLSWSASAFFVFRGLWGSRKLYVSGGLDVWRTITWDNGGVHVDLIAHENLWANLHISNRTQWSGPISRGEGLFALSAYGLWKNDMRRILAPPTTPQKRFRRKSTITAWRTKPLRGGRYRGLVGKASNKEWVLTIPFYLLLSSSCCWVLATCRG